MFTVYTHHFIVSKCFFGIWRQQHISDKLAQGQQMAGKVVDTQKHLIGLFNINTSIRNASDTA